MTSVYSETCALDSSVMRCIVENGKVSVTATGLHNNTEAHWEYSVTSSNCCRQKFSPNVFYYVTKNRFGA